MWYQVLNKLLRLDWDEINTSFRGEGYGGVLDV